MSSCINTCKHLCGPIVTHQPVLSLLPYDILSKKQLLFKSFTGLTVQEFDEIYAGIAKGYVKHEIQRLSKRKYRKREIGNSSIFCMSLQIVL